MMNLIGLRFQTSIIFLCMKAGRKFSSPGKEFQFFIPHPFQVLTVSQNEKCKLAEKFRADTCAICLTACGSQIKKEP
jgi:hypothetical protein